MHIEYLKIFSDLVEKKSFSEAAKANDITQSAVSQQLRTIEKHFDTVIVDRSQKQLRLTEEGQKIHRDSQEILRLYEKLSREISEMGDVFNGTIHVASTYSIGLHVLPDYIKSFIRSYPNVNVRLDYNRTDKVYEDIISNNADVGLVAYPQAHKLLEFKPFREESLVLVCSLESKFAQRKTIQLKELSGQEIVSFESPMPAHKALLKLLEEENISFEITKQFDNVEMIKHAVEIDCGVALLPVSAVENDIDKRPFRVIEFKNSPYKVSLASVHRKGKILSASVEKFIELLIPAH